MCVATRGRVQRGHWGDVGGELDALGKPASSGLHGCDIIVMSNNSVPPPSEYKKRLWQSQHYINKIHSLIGDKESVKLGDGRTSEFRATLMWYIFCL